MYKYLRKIHNIHIPLNYHNMIKSIHCNKHDSCMCYTPLRSCFAGTKSKHERFLHRCWRHTNGINNITDSKKLHLIWFICLPDLKLYLRKNVDTCIMLIDGDNFHTHVIISIVLNYQKVSKIFYQRKTYFKICVNFFHIQNKSLWDYVINLRTFLPHYHLCLVRNDTNSWKIIDMKYTAVKTWQLYFQAAIWIYTCSGSYISATV